MTSASARRPYGVIGVFLVLLGAGVILDDQRTGWGSGVIIAGTACLVAEWRQGREE